jgi:uncharacterized protein
MSEFDLLLVAVVALVGSFVKSVTGMGYPLIAVPALTFFIGVESAVAVIAIPNTILNALLNWGVRETRHETRDLPILIFAALLGGVLGTFILINAPERPLLIGLAISVLAFVVLRRFQPDLALSKKTTKRWSPLVGLAAGISHGAVGVSGPIVALWFHGYRLSKDAYVFCVTGVFLVSGLAQLGVLVGTHAFGRDRLIASSVGLVASLLVMPIGTRVRDRLAGETFERLILILLVFSGISLLWRAFS